MKMQYKTGTKVVCFKMFNDPYAVPNGTIGTIQFVDDIGNIHVEWENGQTLALIPEVDFFSVLREDKRIKVIDIDVEYNEDYEAGCDNGHFNTAVVTVDNNGEVQHYYNFTCRCGSGCSGTWNINKKFKDSYATIEDLFEDLEN